MAVPYAGYIRAAGQQYKIPPSVLAGLIEIESGFNPRSTSPVGAFGITQFMPGTAPGYGVKRGTSPAAVRSQIFGAAKYLAQSKYHSNPLFALGAYNGGAGNPQYGYAHNVLSASHKYVGLNRGVTRAGAPPPGAAGTRHVPGQTRSFDTGPVSATATVTPRAAPEPGGLGGSAELIQSILQRRQQANMVPMTEPAPPSFAASRFLQGAGGFAPPPIPAMSPPTQDPGAASIASILDAMSQRGQGLDPAPQSATARLPGQKGTVTGPGFDVPGGRAVGGGFKAKAHYAVNRRWTPAQIINNVVLPIAHANGVNSGPVGGLSPGEVVAANHQHGPTVSGGRSDHQGPPGTAWAADMSGSKAAMNRLSRSLASVFGIPWSGAGLVTKQFGPYRLQLIHNTMAGGNHFTHVHFGIRR